MKKERSVLPRRKSAWAAAGVACATSVAGGLARPPVAEAISPGYHPPINSMSVPGQGNLAHMGPCHGACPPQSDYNDVNFFAVDLFDGAWTSDPGAPIYGTTYGVVQVDPQRTGVQDCTPPFTGSVGIRYGNVMSGQGFGYYNGHGRSGSIPSGLGPWSSVGPGDIIMKMGNTGTCTGHLHFEIRELMNVGTWTNSFVGYCARHYINKMMADMSVWPYTQAATDFAPNFYWNDCRTAT